MKGSFRTLRITALFVATIVALSYYGHVRAQSGTPKSNVIPLRPLAPLSSVPVPDVPGLSDFVANKAEAIALGKTLFWDMQAGSDGVQACASCHFNAGADSRVMNQVNPGPDGVFDLGLKMAGNTYPNYHLYPGTPDAGWGGYHNGDFPLHKLADPLVSSGVL